MLLDDSVIVGPDQINTTSLIRNNQGRSSWYWEVGPDYRIYPFRLPRVHDEKKFLLPSFSLATGFRKDSRFQYYPKAKNGPTTLLTPNGLESFANPDKRFIRAFTTLTNVGERNFNETKTTSPFNVAVVETAFCPTL